MKKLLGWVYAVCALISGEAQQTEASDIWVVRQDFVKFGKKEIYETAKKEYFQGLSKAIKKRSLFPFYVLQALESPQYLYLTPVGSYGGVDRLVKQQESFQNSFNSQDWEVKEALESSAVNFFFNNLQKFLPEVSFVPKGQESFFSLPHTYLYWIQITPGQTLAFEDHLENLVQEEMKQESPSCWRVWRGTFGETLPSYFIVVFAATEKAAEDAANRVDFISGPVKQIVRKLRQDRAILRSDLSLQVSP